MEETDWQTDEHGVVKIDEAVAERLPLPTLPDNMLATFLKNPPRLKIEP